jgi:VWFA-related protein
MKSRIPLLFFRSTLILLACLSPILARQEGFTLKVDVSLIPLDVAVYDKQENPVKTLTMDDFSVYENGVRQNIQHFESVEAPYTTLLLFDTSGSTINQIGFMTDAGNRFLGNLRLEDQISMASFSVVVTKMLDWRTKRGPSQQIIIQPGAGGTDLYGALAWSAAELGGRTGRRGVLVMTDGLDGTLGSANENLAFQRARTAIEQARSPFYFVMVPANAPANFVTLAHQRMSELADRSGGRVLFPRALSDVAPLYERIAKELGRLIAWRTAPAGPRTMVRIVASRSR